MNAIKALFSLLRDSISNFIRDRATIYAAGLAYYTVFSLAPLLIFTITIAGFFIGRSTASSQITSQLQYIVGSELGGFMASLVQSLNDQATTRTVTILSIIGLLLGASGIFNQLKIALNLLWGIVVQRPDTGREWLLLIRYRAIPFLMVFLFGLLLSLSVILDTVVGVVQARLQAIFPTLGETVPSVSALLVPVLTFVTFLIVYKALPDARVRWRDAAVAALLAALLFLIGRYLVAIFLRMSDTGSLYGAAGSIILLLIWIYFSAIILIFGAEFLKLYAQRYGRPIRPNKLAEFRDAAGVTDWSPRSTDLRPDDLIA